MSVNVLVALALTALMLSVLLSAAGILAVLILGGAVATGATVLPLLAEARNNRKAIR